MRPHPHNLAEFALHGAKYAFPGVRLPLAVGVPTSHSAPAFAGVFAPGSTDFVWPHPNGSVRGVGVEPLHPSVPFAAMQDAKLYEMLALFDALRVGKARERGMALERRALLAMLSRQPARRRRAAKRPQTMSAPLRVVLDTNVVLSALVFGGGATGRLRLGWQQGTFVPLASTATVQELVRVLATPSSAFPRPSKQELLADYLP